MVISEAQTTNIGEPHLEPDVGDIDLSDLLLGGIYDYLKNRVKKLLEAVPFMGEICPRQGHHRKSLHYLFGLDLPVDKT